MLNDVLLSGLISFVIMFLLAVPALDDKMVTISDVAFYSLFVSSIAMVSTLLVLSQYVNG